jgi:hypothetical protein
MASITSPREICVATTIALSTDCCLSTLTWWDWKPGTVGEIFNEMPAGVVDFDLAAAAGFDQPHRGVNVTFPPLLIELFVEITETDTGGQAANNEIWRLWWCLVNLLYGNRYLNHTVDSCRILSGTVEGFPLEVRETGILARYAWLSLETTKAL